MAKAKREYRGGGAPKGQIPWNKGQDNSKRATRAVTNYRIFKVSKLLATGASRQDVIAYAMQEWDLSQSRSKDIYLEAMKEIKETWEMDRTDFAALLLQQLNDLHKKTSARQNDGVTLGCINSAAKIARLFD